ncbi:hypothetical protein HPB52_016802 [Rhipicephalus sanguineus]|uniref:Uncharacterized protein n=1 Tax=Rhipicephalus sanguineus TaxID=34632 RepID=A0A9D4SUR5_RHISA|nr:hypothetical protein HPB52_016802 [Rhipicephalus sanguineus]
MPPSDLKALIRAIIREELRDLEQQRSTAVSTPPAPFDLWNLVKQELAAMTTPTAPVAPPARPLPTYADEASMTTPTASVAQTVMPTYADIAAIPPAAANSSSDEEHRPDEAAATRAYSAAEVAAAFGLIRRCCGDMEGTGLSHLDSLDKIEASIFNFVSKTKKQGLLVRRLLANIDRKHEGDLRISLLDAIHFIAMAWDRVTPTTIANCFAKCGFFRSSEEVPSEQEEPIEGWELLDAGCTAEDFCTADDNLATCGARTVEDIVEEATCEVADSSDDGDNIDEGDGEGLPPAAETLHALDVLRRAMAADEISDDTVHT